EHADEVRLEINAQGVAEQLQLAGGRAGRRGHPQRASGSGTGVTLISHRESAGRTGMAGLPDGCIPRVAWGGDGASAGADRGWRAADILKRDLGLVRGLNLRDGWRRQLRQIGVGRLFE